MGSCKSTRSLKRDFHAAATKRNVKRCAACDKNGKCMAQTEHWFCDVARAYPRRGRKER
jgi:hypothetical protein